MGFSSILVIITYALFSSSVLTYIPLLSRLVSLRVVWLERLFRSTFMTHMIEIFTDFIRIGLLIWIMCEKRYVTSNWVWNRKYLLISNTMDLIKYLCEWLVCWNGRANTAKVRSRNCSPFMTSRSYPLHRFKAPRRNHGLLQVTQYSKGGRR